MSMTNKNMNCKETAAPFLLEPAYKDYLWGGSRLKAEYGKNTQTEPLAESWECSTHPDGVSIIASGSYAGTSLAEALAEHPEWIGSHPDTGAGGLPVLMKLIDAQKDLSVQVHPDDEYALREEHQRGKTEMWYVLDAAPGATLLFGWKHDMDRAKLQGSITNKTILQHLQAVTVEKDDVFLVKPGTVHGIGGGVLLAEIQECSNVTYRLFDYDRLDKNGQPRALHIDKAMEVLNYREEPEVHQQMRVMRYHPGAASESLCRCQYFQVERILVTAKATWCVEDNSFQVILVTEGCLEIWWNERKQLTVEKGHSVFFPADCGEVTVTGKGKLLKICC